MAVRFPSPATVSAAVVKSGIMKTTKPTCTQAGLWRATRARACESAASFAIAVELASVLREIDDARAEVAARRLRIGIG